MVELLQDNELVILPMLAYRSRAIETSATSGCFSLEEAICDPNTPPPEWIWAYAEFQFRPVDANAEIIDDSACEDSDHEGDKDIWLPPDEAWLIDPRKVKFRTPLDENGEVDQDTLIRLVNATVRPEYVWKGNHDPHHAQWPRASYAALQYTRPEVAPLAYRNVPANIMYVPRLFHNWLHKVTLPPPLPSTEVMADKNEEWLVYRGFFDSVHHTANFVRVVERDRHRRELEGKPYSDAQEKLLRDMHIHNLSGVFRRLQELQEMPVERWPFSPLMTPQEAAGHIGSLILDGWQRRTRAVREREVA